MSIEVEKRGLLEQKVYLELPEKLRLLGAKNYGENNTSTVFYLLDRAQLKLQVLSSKRQAKIAWKSGGFDGSAHRREIEVNIDYDSYESATDLLEVLVPSSTKKVPTEQKRQDFELDDLSIALKYSDHWGYHIEIDKNVTDELGVDDALEQINTLANKLGIKLFSEEEEAKFVAGLLAKV